MYKSYIANLNYAVCSRVYSKQNELPPTDCEYLAEPRIFFRHLAVHYKVPLILLQISETYHFKVLLLVLTTASATEGEIDNRAEGKGRCKVNKCAIKDGLQLLNETVGKMDSVETELAMLHEEVTDLKRLVDAMSSATEAKLSQLTSKDNELQNGQNSLHSGLSQVDGRMGSAEGKLSTLPGRELLNYEKT